MQSSTNPEQWRYVPTRINPADLLSRGMRAGKLRDCGSWWRGPDFLMTSEELWPTNKVIDKPTEDDELKRSTGYQLKSKAETNGTNGFTHEVEEAHPVFVTTNDAIFAIDPCQYSSWLRLRRVLAWVNRFVDNCHKTQRERNVRELRNDELKAAEIQLIKQEQSKEFKEEWIAYLAGNHCRQAASWTKTD